MRVCPNCGFEVTNEAAKFCRQCGTKLSDPEPTTPEIPSDGIPGTNPIGGILLGADLQAANPTTPTPATSNPPTGSPTPPKHPQPAGFHNQPMGNTPPNPNALNEYLYNTEEDKTRGKQNSTIAIVLVIVVALAIIGCLSYYLITQNKHQNHDSSSESSVIISSDSSRDTYDYEEDNTTNDFNDELNRELERLEEMEIPDIDVDDDDYDYDDDYDDDDYDYDDDDY